MPWHLQPTCQTNGEIIEILCLTIHKTQYYVRHGFYDENDEMKNAIAFMMSHGQIWHGFYDENDEISKNAIAFTADEPKIWGK